jgi:D-serine deaminase-like pyridoxal phosphate-dependent protein
LFVCDLSGAISGDKSPQPFLPKGIAPFKDEGFGEVQTPFEVPLNVALKVEDPVLVRPSKSGEIAERFDEYLCVKDGKLAFKCKTYRGLGKTFF